MPWHVETDHPDCSGYAVVKDETGELVGCHETEESAVDQITALAIAESEDEDRAVADVDLTPTSEMSDLAARGVAYYEDGKAGDGVVDATVREARAIARGDAISPEKVVKMRAWFARHLPDLDSPKNSNPDDDDYPGPGAVAWLLWAGDPLDPDGAGAAWSERKVAELEREGYRFEERAEDDEPGDDAGESGLSPRQRILYEKYEWVAETFGKFSKDSGPDGCSYLPESENPYETNCAACYFYRDGLCEIVDGEIEPGGFCKFSIAGEGSGETVEDDDSGYDLGMASSEESASPERSTIRGGVEWRESGAGKDYRTIRGYAAIWGARSEDLGGFVETLDRGAFRAALEANADVALLYNHDDATIMARTTAGTLELREDENGLRIWARVDMSDPDTARVIGKMNAGSVSQMSFRFSLADGGDSWDSTGGTPLRTIREDGISRLYEVSLVPFPAYPETKAAVFDRAIESGRLLPGEAEYDAAREKPADVADPSVEEVDGGRSNRRAEEVRLRASLWETRLRKHLRKDGPR